MKRYIAGIPIYKGSYAVVVIIRWMLIAVLAVLALFLARAEAGDLSITTPLGTTIERVEAADAEAVAEAVGRADFMRQYGTALTVPTVTSNCSPKVLQVNGTEVIAMDCAVQFFDPRRLSVPPEFMTRPTRWTDVANTLVGGTRDVAVAAIGASPYALAAYAVNQVRKGSGNNRTYNDSFNSDSSDRGVDNSVSNTGSNNTDNSDHSTTDNSDHSDNSDQSTHTADNGSVLGDGRIGDDIDNTHDPTIVVQPPPIVVEQPPPIVINQPDP